MKSIVSLGSDLLFYADTDCKANNKQSVLMFRLGFVFLLVVSVVVTDP